MSVKILALLAGLAVLAMGVMSLWMIATEGSPMPAKKHKHPAKAHQH